MSKVEIPVEERAKISIEQQLEQKEEIKKIHDIITSHKLYPAWRNEIMDIVRNNLLKEIPIDELTHDAIFDYLHLIGKENFPDEICQEINNYLKDFLTSNLKDDF